MTRPVPQADDADLAEQAASVDDASDIDAPDEDLTLSGEADPADVFEQHQRVPSGDDDYDR
ncbi:MAG TPA: hypothetical protein VFR17_04915 [Mycobacterium sp.]|nr:hypothetical protein [Mycobacterium sp.]